MNWKLGPVLALLLVAGESFAQEVPKELENLQRLFRSKMNKEVGPVKAIYLRELASLERKLLATGRKEEASLVNAEKQAWQTGKVIDMKIIRPKPPKINLPLKELLPGSVWEYWIETNGKEAGRGHIIFQPGGKLFLAVPNGGPGKWIAEGDEKVIFTVGSYPPGVVTISKDRMTFSGNADLIQRFGKLAALPLSK
ncbi:hypothetical protein N9Z77_01890 [Akkermansiaceae bacterium]|nr:hypothetical protein [Akkermansiaceae bacterium]